MVRLPTTARGVTDVCMDVHISTSRGDLPGARPAARVRQPSAWSRGGHGQLIYPHGR